MRKFRFKTAEKINELFTDHVPMNPEAPPHPGPLPHFVAEGKVIRRQVVLSVFRRIGSVQQND
jgi:hypothetical protein